MILSFINKYYEVEDPGYYDSLIFSLKKRIKKDNKNSDLWLNLGKLQYEKRELTEVFVKKHFHIRWIPILTYLSFLFFLYLYVEHLYLKLPLPIGFLGGCLLTVSIIFVTKVRYPSSGKKYFLKALQIKPNIAEAYIYLGLISLNKNRKRKACKHFEKAYELGAETNLKPKLKKIYHQEFIKFFNQEYAMAAESKEKNDELMSINVKLREKIKNLESRNSGVLKKFKETKSIIGNKFKKDKILLRSEIEENRKKFQSQIDNLEQAMEEEISKREAAQKHNVELSLEILESKAQSELHSLKVASENAEKQIGSRSWLSLSTPTQSYISTAEHAFNLLDKFNKNTDFSLVGMELCKALETEINYRLVQPFIDFLGPKIKDFLDINKINEINEQPIYYTMLAKVVDQINYPEVKTLTLGQYLFVLKKTFENEMALDEYGLFLDHMQKTFEIYIERNFLKNLKVVTQDYRNAIVHHTHMSYHECMKMRKIIFAGRESLLATISNGKMD